jgi:hypothetical protein
MGFVLTVLYLVIYFLTPTTLFGPLAVLHIELILAVLLVAVSVPSLSKSFTFKTPQALALPGMAVAVFLSILIGIRWPGGAVHSFLGFIPNIFAYFLVCLHCNTKKKLQVLVVMLFFVCLFVIAHGYADLLRGYPETGPMHPGMPESAAMTVWDIEHPYMLAMTYGDGAWIYRLRGLGDINDPNDFGQVIVCVIPLMFILWRKGRPVFNFLCVIVPSCLLLFGAFLTHSRGALLALTAVAVVAARRRIGTIPSLLVAGALFVGASVTNFTGGREISANAGSDRTGLWGQGLEMLKSHPIFGVGFGNFRDYCGCGHTAHNSILVSAGELGMFGLFFWCLFLLPTVRDAFVIASPKKVEEGTPPVPEESFYPQTVRTMEVLDKAEINRLGTLVFLSIIGFLTAGFFLSRAYVLTLFLLGGMAEAVFDIGLRQGMIVPRMPAGRVFRLSAALTFLMVVMMYMVVRVLNLMH